MIRRFIATTFTAVTLALTSAVLPSAAHAQSGIGLPVGETPEAVTLEDLDGNPVELGDYIGKKPVLVEFWARWCPLCAELEPQLHRVSERHGDAVAVLVVAVGVNQSPRSIRRHLKDHPLPGQVLWDGAGKAVRAFKAPGTSYIVVLNEKGEVVYTGLGADQDLEAAVAEALPPRPE